MPGVQRAGVVQPEGPATLCLCEGLDEAEAEAEHVRRGGVRAGRPGVQAQPKTARGRRSRIPHQQDS